MNKSGRKGLLFSWWVRKWVLLTFPFPSLFVFLNEKKKITDVPWSFSAVNCFSGTHLFLCKIRPLSFKIFCRTTNIGAVAVSTDWKNGASASPKSYQVWCHYSSRAPQTLTVKVRDSHCAGCLVFPPTGLPCPASMWSYLPILIV